MDEKTLLELAKGVRPATEINNRAEYWKRVPVGRLEIERKRKLARRALHKITKYRRMNKELPEHLEDACILKEQIGALLNSNFGITWETFAWKWDLHPQDHTKIILKEKWILEGGGFDPEFGTHAPTAFTKNGSDLS